MSVRIHSVSFLVMLSLCQSAQSQTACGIIPQYLNSPPKAFIKERGESSGENTWVSNQSRPGARCTIRYSEITKQHSSSCLYITETEDAALAFYSKITSELNGCFSKFDEPWSKTTGNTSNAEGKYISTTWSKEMNGQSFRFTTSRSYNTATERWTNSVRVSFDEGD